MKKIFINKKRNISIILILTIFISACTINEPQPNEDIKEVLEIPEIKESKTIINIEEIEDSKSEEKLQKETVIEKEQQENEIKKPEEPIIPEGCGNLLNNENVMFGYPSTEHILERQAYVISHDDNKKVATWVSYHLTAEYLKVNAIRSDKFKADPDILKGNRAELVDYKGSGYDRGHIAPSADMLRSQSINDESFLLSNMAPQTASFNRGIWKKLESLVRDWAKIRESIWIISGPIFDTDYQTIGPNQVGVPQRFFKIVISGKDCDFDAISFIFSNEKGENPLEDYIISINDIESATGLDFLDVLEDTLEENIESTSAEGLWAS